jgi:hypothetical protein
MAVIKDSSLIKPFILDIVKIASNKPNQYDLPFYYLGQLMQTNFEYSTPKSLFPLGTTNGYQHLYNEGKGVSNGNNTTLNWLLRGKFYTLTSVTSKGDELLFARIGANDPSFNLRRDPVFILRKKNSKDALFVSIIESHGVYSPVSELAINAYSQISKLEVLFDDPNYTAVAIWTKDENSKLFMVSNTNNEETQTHQLSINGKEYQWTGPFAFQKIK